VLGSQGLVWGVTADALPLAPGEVLTLTVGDTYYFTKTSNVTWPLAEGTPVYAQVDSANAETDYGAVLEYNEKTGGTYNNISSTSSTAGIVSTELLVVTGDRSPAARGGLPPRQSGGLRHVARQKRR